MASESQCYYEIMSEEPLSLPCADKLAFDTPKQAQTAATVALHQYGTVVKVYRCRHCGLWHLSSV